MRFAEPARVTWDTWDMTSDGFTLDSGDMLDDKDPGAYLRISRDATADDLEFVLPDKTPDERAAWLADLKENANATVTMAVVTEVPVTSVQAFGQAVPAREITGLIFGPPGSEQFLRRPTMPRVRADGARHDAEPADPEARDLVCLFCAGRLVPLVDGGHEHADDADTRECIAAHDGMPPAVDRD